MLLHITLIESCKCAWLNTEVFRLKNLLHNRYVSVVMEIICSMDIRPG
jgi:hypothetical protein